MAEDKLIFPIGFDLEDGVKQVEKDWENTYRKRLQSVIDSKPIKIKLNFDANGVNLKDYKEYIALSKQAAQSAKENAEAREAEAKAREREAAAMQRESNARVTANTEEERTRKIKAQAALTEERLTQAKLRGANATNAQNSAYKTQSSYLKRLVTRMAAYASVQQLIHFVRNIREVTAEFELQRVALGALIGDMNRANLIFEQIKVAAVKSPFEVKDLVTYTKQLAAYKVNADELFDTTQRLADISAGLGVSMDRLILAYGQVKATGYLRASEVRQFTEAGIPIVDELAKKMSEFRNETVSAADVMGMISERAISFEQVKDVFDDMTSAGGMFYKMQEVQSETLRGQINNLKDSFTIMYEEMGRNPLVNKTMKWLVESTKSLARNWEYLVAVVITAANAYIGFKAGQFIMSQLTTSITKQQVAIRNLIRAKKALQQAEASGNQAVIYAARLQYQSARAAARATFATNGLTRAWERLKAAFMSNPIGFIITIVTTFVTMMTAATSKATELARALSRIGEEGNLQTEQDVRKFERLAKTITETVDGSKEQTEALENMKRAFGDLLPAQDEAIKALLREKQGYLDINQAIRDKIALQTKERRESEASTHYAEKLEPYKRQLREAWESEGLSREEIATRFAEMEKDAKEAVANGQKAVMGVMTSFAEGLNDQLSWMKYFSTPIWAMYNSMEEQVAETYARGYLVDYYKTLQDIGDEYEAQIGAFGEYQKEVKALYEDLGKVSSEYKVGSFAWREDINKRQKEVYNTRFAELAYIAHEKGVISTEELYNESWEKLIGILAERADGAQGIFRKLRDEYRLLFPNDITDTVNKSIESVANTTKVSLDDIVKYLKGNNESMDDWEKKMKSSLENASKSVLQFKAALAYAKENNLPTVGALGSALKEAEQTETLLKKLNEIWKFDTQKTKSRGKDPWIEKMENRIKFIQDFQKGVEKFSKSLDKATALDYERIIMKSRGNALGIDVSQLEGSVNNTISQYKAMMRNVVDQMIKIDSSLKNKIKGDVGDELAKSALSIDTKNKKILALQELLSQLLRLQTDIEVDGVARDIENKLKAISEKVSRTKEAKEFYDKILGQTGDKELSASLTLSVYGSTGQNLQEQIIKQVKEAFAGQDLSKVVNDELETIDLAGLRSIYESLPDDFAPNQKKAMENVIKALEKSQGNLMDKYAKLLMQFDSDAQKRVNIEQKAAQDVMTIREGLAEELKAIDKDESIVNKEQAKANAQQRADAAIKAIEGKAKLDLARLDADYVRFFAAINTMTLDEANNLRKELRGAMYDAFHQGAISADELRKELKAIDAQFQKLTNNASIFATYMTSGIDGMINKLRESGDELSAIAIKLQQGKSLETGEINFVDKILNIFGDKGMKSFGALADKFKGNTSQMGDAIEQVGDKMQGMFSSAAGAISIVDMIIKSVHQSVEAVKQIIDQINSMRSEDNQIGGWFNYISDFNKYAFSGWENLKSGNIMGAIADTISSIISIFQNVQRDKIEKLNETIEEQEAELEKLSYAYGRLEKAQAKAFGTDYIDIYQQKLDNLQAQYDAYSAQYKGEEGKGKAADSKKMDAYQQSMLETTHAMEDIRGELSNFFLGTDLTSAAKDFAQAWVEAYKEFGNTTDAMQEKFEDMIQNMITNSLAAAIMEKSLEPLFTTIDNMTSQDLYDPTWWNELMSTGKTAIANGSYGLETLYKWLESIGIETRSLGSELTGVSRDIASASEESILGLAAGINTQNFYISQVPTKMDEIIALLQGQGISQGSNITLQDLITIQNQHLSYLPNIAQNTADTVAECKAIVLATQRAADALDKVIKPINTQTNFKLHTSL